MTEFKIRDENMNIVARSASLRTILQLGGEVERIDLWGHEAPVQVGVAWVSGHSCISDVEIRRECLIRLIHFWGFGASIVEH